MEEQKENSNSTIERDNNISKFLKSHYIFFFILIALVIFGAYIRYLPLTDHNGRPGLWDITTNDYTLGPDLDPYLFLRYAKAIDETGSIPAIDTMRYAPLGYDTSGETKLLPVMIYFTYKGINYISSTSYSMEYAAALFPVIMFILTIIVFFFFVKELFFNKKEENKFKAYAIASISTFFLIVVPSLLARTVAGIPEKESAGFFFMFLAFYLFIMAWKKEKIVSCSIYGLLAGFATALMGLIWGGVTYIYVAIGIVALAAFILNKFEKRHYFSYILWYIGSVLPLIWLSNKFSPMSFLLHLDRSLAFFVIIIILIHSIIEKFKIYEKVKAKYPKITIPNTLLTIIVSLVVALIGASILISPSFIWNNIMDLNKVMFNPSAGGRWVTTVAENQQPYFTQWSGNFGVYFLWMFLCGSILYVWSLFKNLDNKDRTIIVFTYIFFLFGLIFSRYAAYPSLFNGENFISKSIYLISALCFFGSLIYYYFSYHKKGKESAFDNIRVESILAIILFILCLFSARSAVRLIMVLASVAPIFVGYLIVESTSLTIKEKDNTKKMFLGLFVIVIVIGSIYSGVVYYNITKNQAENYIPYYYTMQWQQGMDWIRDTTPTDAVFAHWWDYGYWVQSIGERATVTDGGNSIVYWNYLMGRNVLTGNNQKDSLEFLYTHETDYLLIDSSDIGKYGAFSQIGSDKDLDRFSAGPLIMVTDQKNMQETKYGVRRIYQGGNYMDEDIIYNGTAIFKEQGAIVGTTIETYNGTYMQPQGIFYNRGNQDTVPIRYLYTNGEMIDFKTGIEAVVYPIQSMTANGGGYQVDEQGAVIYISPRVLKGFLAQVYILDDPFNNFPAFKVAYKQNDFILQQFEAQGLPLNDFVYYQGIKGPITIWNITYPDDQQSNSEYLNTVFPEEIDWAF